MTRKQQRLAGVRSLINKREFWEFVDFINKKGRISTSDFVKHFDLCDTTADKARHAFEIVGAATLPKGYIEATGVNNMPEVRDRTHFLCTECGGVFCFSALSDKKFKRFICFACGETIHHKPAGCCHTSRPDEQVKINVLDEKAEQLMAGLAQENLDIPMRNHFSFIGH